MNTETTNTSLPVESGADAPSVVTQIKESLPAAALKTVHLMPSILLFVAAIFLLRSLSQPFWTMHLEAVQYDYRDGLNIDIYVNEMKGRDPEFDELRELNSLNHYIGMRPLDDAARFERSIAKPSVYIFAAGLVLLSVVLALFRKRLWSKWFWLLAFPPLLFPYVFAGDLYFWLRDSGQSLDCLAPLSFSVERFTPPIMGSGTVGQFTTVSSFVSGWYSTSIASLLILGALLFALTRFAIVVLLRLNHWMKSRSQQNVAAANA